MDTKILVDKALKGEDYSKEIEALPEEQRTQAHLEIRKGLKEASDAEQVRLVGLRQAAKAIEDKGKEKTEDFARFKQDQIEIAKAKFFSDPKFPIKEEAKEAFLAEYAKNNSGAVDANLILNDFKRNYASFFADDLLKDRETLASMAKGAAAFNAGGANAAGTIDTPENEKYSKEAKNLFMLWKSEGHGDKTLDQAEAIVKSGKNWRARDLSK